MFGYISQKEHNRKMLHVIDRHNKVLDDYNALVRRINKLGGEAFLKKAKIPNNDISGFSEEDIRSMIYLCHPDKHNSSSASTRITQMLIARRDSFKK